MVASCNFDKMLICLGGNASLFEKYGYSLFPTSAWYEIHDPRLKVNFRFFCVVDWCSAFFSQGWKRCGKWSEIQDLPVKEDPKDVTHSGNPGYFQPVKKSGFLYWKLGIAGGFPSCVEEWGLVPTKFPFKWRCFGRFCKCRTCLPCLLLALTAQGGHGGGV